MLLLVLDEYVIGNSYWSSATGERWSIGCL